MTNPAQEQRSQAPAPLPVPDSAVRQPLPTPPPPFVTPSDSTDASESATGLPADLDKRLAFAEQVHQYIREYIKLADQKAGFFFTASTAILAFLYKVNASARWLKPVLQWNVVDTAAFVAMVALAVAAVTSLVVVIPRTPGSRRGYLFWEAIAEYDSCRQYADDLACLSVPTLLQIKAEHCHDLAKVCRRKYRTLRAALSIGTVGLAASLFVFLFGG